MDKKTRGQRISSTVAIVVGPRGWGPALFWAGVVVGLTLVASAVINPLFGRSVHWDWVAGIAPISFAVFAIAFRRRWV
ncbi:MAG: hypothetical protein QF467_00030 [SAR202 cluster bacterium]|jgi:hypothetical protein|nr:hypothetical protein [SAR202 cluster bacterium]